MCFWPGNQDKWEIYIENHVVLIITIWAIIKTKRRQNFWTKIFLPPKNGIKFIKSCKFPWLCFWQGNQDKWEIYIENHVVLISTIWTIIQTKRRKNFWTKIFLLPKNGLKFSPVNFQVFLARKSGYIRNLHQKSCGFYQYHMNDHTN